jgi:hypothetical protein
MAQHFALAPASLITSADATGAPPPKLRNRLRIYLRTRHYSIRREEA